MYGNLKVIIQSVREKIAEIQCEKLPKLDLIFLFLLLLFTFSRFNTTDSKSFVL